MRFRSGFSFFILMKGEPFDKYKLTTFSCAFQKARCKGSNLFAKCKWYNTLFFLLKGIFNI